MLLPDNFTFSQNNLQDYVDCKRRFLLRHVQKLEWPAIESEPVLEQEQLMLLGQQFHLMVQQKLSGIPEEIKERLFFPLVSGRHGGSGLGLNLAQTFVQQHHGLIECDSVPGRTDFKILIPLP